MSKDRLLSDEELEESIDTIFDSIGKLNADPIASKKQQIFDLINTQKRLYAER